ncbi:hypothetical protein C900_05267 [Fulvivirga imtechensis AK7]|uniref:Fibronectin type-III domain-containing protein n=1 Tax=Fulvivirga imtechensis AK7 TaxID=1237149 RepID=L8JYH4_9BACT|nr:hypothetical protein [Fulvivirga imtechensis]ELR73218.1 hypothetical protein C900_05267 [Fulvivirga imtechensis AK7]
MKKVLLIILMAFNYVAMAQELPPPKGLSASFVVENNERYILLNWEKDAGDTLTTGYNILTNFPPKEDLLILGKAGVVYKTSYKYKLTNNRAAKYRFAVMGLQNFPRLKRSKPSEVVEVLVPSSSLPNIEIEKAYYKDGAITLIWDYDAFIRDVKGYHVYLNGQLIETIEKPGQMLWTKNFEEKGKYIFEIAAITTSGVLSRKSQKKLVKIE